MFGKHPAAGAAFSALLAVSAPVANALPADGRYCADETWARLKAVLLHSYHHTDYKTEFNAALIEITDPSSFDWYKENYQDCVEGFLSLVLYLAIHSEPRRAALLKDLADLTARELNPLALRSGLSTWPYFGLLEDLHLVWQDGVRATPLPTEPWRIAPCADPPPGRVASFLGALAAGGKRSGSDFSPASPMQLVRGLRPGALLVDAGVFDGTDWALEGVLAGATVLGFEPLAKNHRVFEERFSAALAEALSQQGAPAPHHHHHALLPVVPGEPHPRSPWAGLFPPPHYASTAGEGRDHRLGHAFVLGAALGERVRALNMTTRYDYSSIADQAYLRGPADMMLEQVAMTTLDLVFDTYLAPGEVSPGPWIDVLKVDVEGYEMGALRGAERLLAEGRVKYLVLEFHPGMLGTTGTDPVGLLEFLRHYCFSCQSLKIDRAHDFEEFVARYTSSAEMLPVQGLGALEDLVCENLWWRAPAPARLVT